MPKSGLFTRALRFESPAPLPEGDAAGNFEVGWQERCTVSASVQPRVMGEAVIAARLTGRQPVTITVRRSAATAEIGPGWRAVDVRSGVVYAVTSPPADMAQDGATLEIMATAGVAA